METSPAEPTQKDSRSPDQEQVQRADRRAFGWRGFPPPGRYPGHRRRWLFQLRLGHLTTAATAAQTLPSSCISLFPEQDPHGQPEHKPQHVHGKGTLTPRHQRPAGRPPSAGLSQGPAVDAEASVLPHAFHWLRLQSQPPVSSRSCHC